MRTLDIDCLSVLNLDREQNYNLMIFIIVGNQIIPLHFQLKNRINFMKILNKPASLLKGLNTQDQTISAWVIHLQTLYICGVTARREILCLPCVRWHLWTLPTKALGVCFSSAFHYCTLPRCSSGLRYEAFFPLGGGLLPPAGGRSSALLSCLILCM